MRLICPQRSPYGRGRASVAGARGACLSSRRWRGNSGPNSIFGGAPSFEVLLRSSSSSSSHLHASPRTTGKGFFSGRRYYSSGFSGVHRGCRGYGAAAEQQQQQQQRYSTSSTFQMLPLQHHRGGSSPSRSTLAATAGRDDGDFASDSSSSSSSSVDDEPSGANLDDAEASAAARREGAAGAATGWQGWVDEVVAKVKDALPEPTEAKKILPLGLMLFFILFDYTILRDTKVSGGFRRHGEKLFF